MCSRDLIQARCGDRAEQSVSVTDEQIERLRPFFFESHGRPRVDDRRVLSDVVFVNRNGLRWQDAPSDYGPHEMLYDRRKRWGEAGVFTRMMKGLAAFGAEPKTVMIDATYLTTHHTKPAGKKGGLGRLIRRTRGGMNTKLHAVASTKSRLSSFFLIAGQVSDHTGAAALLDDLPKAQSFRYVR